MRLACLVSVLLATAACERARQEVLAEQLRQCADPDRELALRACTQLIDRPGPTGEWLALAHYNRATARHAGKDLDGALADLDRALELSPGWVEALTNRGAVHFDRGELDAALRDFEAAIATNPGQAMPHANLATALERMGRPAAALAHYDRAIELAPQAPQPASGRCWTRAVLGRDLEAALADCDRALAADPEDHNSRNSRGFVNFRLGRLADAIADYDRAIAGDPSVASSFYVRALALKAQGRIAQSDQDRARAFALDPDIARRYAAYGIVDR